MNENTKFTKEHKKNNSFNIISGIIAIIIFIICSTILGLHFNNNKPKPNIKHNEDWLNLVINIDCEYNYDYVTLTIELADKNFNIIKTTTKTGYKYKKNNTYQIKYTANISDTINIRYVNVYVSDYK